MKRALAIGCGGTLGFAWAAVALRSIEEALGWDARTADVLLGTSMGSEMVAVLGSGRSAQELVDALESKPRADAILVGHFREHPGIAPPLPRPRWPARGLVGAGLRRRAMYTALAGLLPCGSGDASWLRAFGAALAPNGWVSHPATWIVAADAATGERVAFGSPEAPKTTLGEAIAASWAIPGWFPPPAIGERRYVDGGAVSSVSADFLRGKVDEVILLAPMVSEGGARARGLDRLERLLRSQMTRVVDAEVAELRASGVRVLRVEPTIAELDAMGPNFMNVARRDATLRAAREAHPARVEAIRAANG